MNKKNPSESDISDKFVRPAMLAAGWHALEQIYAQYPLRAGRVVVRRKTARRDASTVLRADFALFFKANIPLAAVEVKDNQHAVGAGMAQAIHYAELLDVPFCFTSNGNGFVFRDATLTGGVLEQTLSLDEFPSPQELWHRYCTWKGWLVMSGSDRDKLLRLVNTNAAPFYGSQIQSMPELGPDFIAHIAQLIARQRPELADISTPQLHQAFMLYGQRPQFFMEALCQVLSPLATHTGRFEEAIPVARRPAFAVSPARRGFLRQPVNCLRFESHTHTVCPSRPA